MPIFFDPLQGKIRSVPQAVLDAGGMYVDQLTGELGYIPKNRVGAATYLDPISMLVISKPSGSSLWTPAQLTTEAWYDAADEDTITESGGAVSQWDDKSGNDRHVANASGSTQPPYNVSDSRLNNKPSVGYDGQRSYLTTSVAFAMKRVYTVMYYDNPTFVSWDPIIADPVDNSPRWTGWSTQANFQDNGSDTIYKNGHTDVNYADGADVAPMPPTIWENTWDGTPNNTWRLFSGPNTWQMWTIHGALGEMICTDGTEDLETKQKIEGYLAWKWCLQSKLPIDHPYRWDGTLFGYGTLWQPSAITTEGWWDASVADYITESGGFVSQLDDLSGNSQHLTQPTGSFQPQTGTHTLNGLNMLYFAGDALATYGDNFAMPASGNMAISQLCEVFLPLSSTAAGMFAMLNASGVDWQFVGGVNTADFNGRLVVTELGGVNTNFASPMGIGPSVYTVVFDYDSGTITGYLTGEEFTGTIYTIKVTDPQTFITMANRVGQTIAGHWGECLITEDVSVGARQKIEGYLAWKWGIQNQLPVGHPYKDAAPLVGSGFGPGFGPGFG